MIGEDICIGWDRWPDSTDYTMVSRDKKGVYRRYEYCDGALFHPARISSVRGSLLGHLAISTRDDWATTYYFRKTAKGYEECQIDDVLRLSPYYREKLEQVLSPTVSLAKNISTAQSIQGKGYDGIERT